jgi:hypothetical protein
MNLPRILLYAVVSMVAPPALADHKVYSPYVEEDILEFEARGHRSVNPAPEKDGQQTHKYEFAYGVNSWWQMSIFSKLKKDPGGRLDYDATAWENIFQLAPQGKYWVDVGVYAEYTRAAKSADPDEIEFKLLLEKDVDPFVFTTNLIFNRDIGRNAGKGVGFEYAVRARYPWERGIEFGVEAFGEPGRLTGFPATSDQEHVIGPVILGKFNVNDVPGVFKYNVGYLFGLTPGSPKGTAKWEFEYEIPF